MRGKNNQEEVYSVELTMKEMQAIVKAARLIRNNTKARRAFHLLKPISNSFKESLLFKFGVTDDEVPF